ncbi:hypothetical protein BDN72DRAFT_906137 [Pluteus cervinus]|uniref:Uncharacterized protein n=1 Tax=Pluteus cervinus TaxID=181527 RepID=A0ACD3A0D9_9AGAR|nr:hypothetical protein BDN72DRAFT_906137 [Pluteus cervinus]
MSIPLQFHDPYFHERTRIEADIQSLEKRLQDLRATRNTFLPISTLPPDILCCIFQIAKIEGRWIEATGLQLDPGASCTSTPVTGTAGGSASTNLELRQCWNELPRHFPGIPFQHDPVQQHYRSHPDHPKPILSLSYFLENIISFPRLQQLTLSSALDDSSDPVGPDRYHSAQSHFPNLRRVALTDIPFTTVVKFFAYVPIHNELETKLSFYNHNFKGEQEYIQSYLRLVSLLRFFEPTRSLQLVVSSNKLELTSASSSGAAARSITAERGIFFLEALLGQGSAFPDSGLSILAAPQPPELRGSGDRSDVIHCVSSTIEVLDAELWKCERQ